MKKYQRPILFIAAACLAGCGDSCQGNPKEDHIVEFNLPAGWCTPPPNPPIKMMTEFKPKITAVPQRPIHRFTIKACFTCNEAAAVGVAVTMKPIATPGQTHPVPNPRPPATSHNLRNTDARGCVTWNGTIQNANVPPYSNDTMTGESYEPGRVLIGRFRKEPIQ